MLSPEIDIAFADGEHHFALKLPQLVELEEKCGYLDATGNKRKRGIVAIYADTRSGLAVNEGGEIVAVPAAGHASASDCREVIRLGLIGGGLDPVDARKLVERYVDTQPVVKAWVLAAAILRAAVEGYEPPKKAPPADEPASE
jgi:hypothetical protein